MKSCTTYINTLSMFLCYRKPNGVSPAAGIPISISSYTVDPVNPTSNKEAFSL